jgi:uncharacterized protein YjbJ (UPF0337 family)
MDQLAETKGKLEETEGKLEETEGKLEETEGKLEETEGKLEKSEGKLKKVAVTSLEKVLQHDDFEVTKIGSDSSHTKGDHVPATATKHSFDLSEISTEKLDETHQSSLLAEYESADHMLFVGAEADVTVLVRMALMDATKLLKINYPGLPKLTIRMERSLFSCRPDILVVSSERYNVPLFAIEVKKDKIGGFLDEERVLGQIFDYVETLAAHGNNFPFVVLSSFEQSVVCWRNDDVNATNLAQDTSLRYTVSPVSGTPEKRQIMVAEPNSASPPEFFTAVSNDEETQTNNTFLKKQERALCASKTYKAHELVSLLYSAMLCALKDCDQIGPPKLHDLSSPLRQSISAIRMTKESYSWGMLDIAMGKPIEGKVNSGTKSRPSQESIDALDKEAYYIIEEAGVGATSKAFHAVNGQGEEVVLKMFVKTTGGNDSTGRGEEGKDTDMTREVNPNAEEDSKPKALPIKEKTKVLTREAFTELADSTTRKECEMLQLFYPQLKDRFRIAVLNRMSCIEMPFFQPVKKDDRQEALESIGEVYKNCFVKHNLKYADEDIRWRHVGTLDMNGKKEYFLFDLADLVSVPVPSKEVEQLFMANLQKRIGTESEGATYLRSSDSYY